jgi:TonB family protein
MDRQAESPLREVRMNYRLRFEKSLALALALLIVCFHAFPRFKFRTTSPGRVNIELAVESVPITHQGGRPTPPPRPVVPVPVDDPAVPEDATIEVTELDFAIWPYNPEGNGGPVGGHARIVPPRPIAEVFPEYPESARKKGLKGIVKLSLFVDVLGGVTEVVVISNSTGSDECAQEAIKAARASRFLPARQQGRAVATWMMREYGFFF